ncbi:MULTISPECIES: hypothetical protein [unclassified Sphingomonas]|uniref:hypothetical protein n=1 Tax=unclassified Sphingomonas TaxID=196159 RepID=UPI002269D92C|nr:MULTISPECIES: hypothetical protein [unclassified Sphingomonas]
MTIMRALADAQIGRFEFAFLLKAPQIGDREGVQRLAGRPDDAFAFVGDVEMTVALALVPAGARRRRTCAWCGTMAITRRAAPSSGGDGARDPRFFRTQSIAAIAFWKSIAPEAQPNAWRKTDC